MDAKGHLMGRLASTVAKQLLNGQHVTLVRTEEINMSGTFFRNKLKFMAFLRKRCLINPQRGKCRILFDWVIPFICVERSIAKLTLARSHP